LNLRTKVELDLTFSRDQTDGACPLDHFLVLVSVAKRMSRNSTFHLSHFSLGVGMGCEPACLVGCCGYHGMYGKSGKWIRSILESIEDDAEDE